MADHSMHRTTAQFGTLPVFMTTISTILGAILFLRFGYAVGHLGFIGVIGLILLGHMVTIPTAMAVAEIATNQKVQGGGAYYIISRSFGLNIGAAIGIALYLSQAISVAFYVIAFSEAFDPLIRFLHYEIHTPMIDTRWIGLLSMSILAVIILTRGANMGMKALYFVVAILFTSLLVFFLGRSTSQTGSFILNSQIESPDGFFYVFTIIFPAFTGLVAGLGLSGDLRDPGRSIPRGTLWATLGGFVVYILVAYKLAISATHDEAGRKTEELKALIREGRLPISMANINLVSSGEEQTFRELTGEISIDADMTVIGFRHEQLKTEGNRLFTGYDRLGNVLYVSAYKKKEIK